MSLRKIASQYRIKTARHLLNIVALQRELETYNVDGLLKAASVGQSKEACLRYAGLQAALLLEKQAVAKLAIDGYTPRGGYEALIDPDKRPPRPGSSPAAPAGGGAAGFPGMTGAIGGQVAPKPTPVAARSGNPKPTRMTGFGSNYSTPVKNQYSMTPAQQDARIAANRAQDAAGQSPTAIQNRIKADASRPAPYVSPAQAAQGPGLALDRANGTDTASRQNAIAAANASYNRGPTPGAGGVVGNNRPPEQQGILDWNINGPNNHSNLPDAPTKGLLMDQAAGTDTASRRAAIGMAGTNVGGGRPIGTGGVVAGSNPGGGMPEGGAAARAAQAAAQAPASSVPANVIPKPSYTEDPVEEAYSKSLNEGAAASQSKAEEDYMKSIEPTAPQYPVGGGSLAMADTSENAAETPAETPAQGSSGFQRQRIIGSGAPVRTMLGNIRGRRGR